jgi:hypothetical protein
VIDAPVLEIACRGIAVVQDASSVGHLLRLGRWLYALNAFAEG